MLNHNILKRIKLARITKPPYFLAPPPITHHINIAFHSPIKSCTTYFTQFLLQFEKLHLMLTLTERDTGGSISVSNSEIILYVCGRNSLGRLIQVWRPPMKFH